MRILYCNKYNFPFSGTEVYLFEAMELMKKQGHEVALFSMADARGEATPYDDLFMPHRDFKSASGFWRRLHLAGSAVYSFEARRRLRAMIRTFHPEVAHVRNIYHHLSPSILWELKAQGVPVIYHLNDFKILCPAYNMVAQGESCERCTGGHFRHALAKRCGPGPMATKAVLTVEAYLHHWMGTYRRCVDRFLAPSHFVRDKLTENGWDGARIDVLPHFQRVTSDAVQPIERNAPVLYFGRLSPEKGLIELIQAMESLPDVHLQIAGDGPQRAELEGLVRRLKLPNVEFLGRIGGPELDHRIAASAFTVLPSRAYETLGKTILESYAAGRAVIATDLGSRRELIEPGVTGLLFPTGNVGRLSKAIAFLHDHPEVASRMGAAGRERVRQRHSVADHYRRLTDLYERVIEGKRKFAEPAGAAQKLKLAFIGGRGVHSRYSGIEAYYEEVGSRLAEAGHSVTVYCRTYFTPPMSEYRGMRLVRLPSIRSKHLETLLHTVLSTLHATFSRCDIVHYHALGPALFSWIPRLAGKKTVVTVQGLDWQRRKWGLLAAMILRLGESASARLPDATMVVSRTLERRYRRRHGVSPFYVPNGTRLLVRGSDGALEKWGLAPDQYALFLGRFSPEKNCHLLIDAFEKTRTPMKLVLAGGSSHTDEYAQGLRNHASERILFLDYVSGRELEELLVNAALFVLPSDLEGLSLALLDAMGAGVCALTSDIPENKELVDGAGFTFCRADVDDLARMLQLLLDDPATRAATGLRGQQRIREQYLWSDITPRIEQVYFSVLGINRERKEAMGEESPLQKQDFRVA